MSDISKKQRMLILRTFAHHRVWEGQDNIIYDGISTCHYKAEDRNAILFWEPNLLEYTLDDFTLAWGIYIEEYFKYKQKTGFRAFRHTPQEEHPSVLELAPIEKGLNRFAKDDDKEIKIAFRLKNKLDDINREDMIEFDKKFVALKITELDKKPSKNERYNVMLERGDSCRGQLVP